MYTNENILTLTAQKSFLFNKQFVTIKESNSVCIITVHLSMAREYMRIFDYARFQIISDKAWTIPVDLQNFCQSAQ